MELNRQFRLETNHVITATDLQKKKKKRSQEHGVGQGQYFPKIVLENFDIQVQKKLDLYLSI